MKTFIALAMFLVSLPAAANALPDWLAGCWEQRGDGFAYEEQWMRPAGGVMLGMSRTVRNGKAVASEYLRIDAAESGKLRYTAMPSGQALAVFTATLMQARRLVFENPAHDFPQRILYTLDGDVLTARIEGESGGKARGVDFVMQRVRCAGSLE